MLALKLCSGSQVGPGTGRYQAGASSQKPLSEHMLTGELSYKSGGSHDAAPGSGVMEKNDMGEWQNCPEHGTCGKQHFVLPLQPLSGELFCYHPLEEADSTRPHRSSWPGCGLHLSAGPCLAPPQVQPQG